MQLQGPMGPWAHAGPKGPAYKLGTWGPSAGKAGKENSEMGPGFSEHVPVHVQHIFFSFRGAYPPFGLSPL